MTTDDIALLTEHFGYPPVSLLDDIINSVNLLAERGLTSIETGLSSAPATSLGFGKPVRPRPPPRSTKKHPAPPQPDVASGGPPPSTPEAIAAAARAEIESGTHRLETLLCASIDRNFDLLELYAMRNILCVRPEDRDWIRLGHYEGLSFDGPAGDSPDTAAAAASPPTVESVSNLRRRLQTAQRLNVALHAEKARNDALLAQLRAVVGASSSPSSIAAHHVKAEDAVAIIDSSAPAPATPPLAFLRATGPLTAADARTPLATSAEFSLSQLAALRTLSSSLRTLRSRIASQAPKPKKHHHHHNGDDDQDDDDDDDRKAGWRAQRARYVDAATRRHLEVRAGLELGAQGEVRAGDWQGPGRAVPQPEVDALEALAAALGPNPADDAHRQSEQHRQRTAEQSRLDGQHDDGDALDPDQMDES
jgi:kinetochore protein Mis12/MTW1